MYNHAKSKIAQSTDSEFSGVPAGVDHSLGEIDSGYQDKAQGEPKASDQDLKDQTKGLPQDAQNAKADLAVYQWWQGVAGQIREMESINADFKQANIMDSLLRDPTIGAQLKRLNVLDPEQLLKTVSDTGGGDMHEMPRDLADLQDRVSSRLSAIQREISKAKTLQQNQRNTMQPNIQPARGRMAYNQEKHKFAQKLDGSRFPITSVGDFIEKFLRDLMAWNGKGKERDTISNKALEEIREAVGQGFEEEAQSALQAVQRMNADEADEAAGILAGIFEHWLSPLVKVESEKTAMSTNVEGIVKFNLSDHILNNKEAGMQKTASAFQSQEYTLYGPSEKRVCPKLRGRNSIGGDIVSEYICRHHCNMGIVLDDANTVCGEAVWRGNIMDKFSREYVDADGNIKGGYIEKRFEVDHNVPQETKMRLKPGETRKPRPVSIYGNYEARMQEMRNKEGEKRGYRPTTDTSKPFDWVKDIDQNNVEVTQKERDRREEDSGHMTAKHFTKENDPELSKKAEKNDKWMQDASEKMEEHGTKGTFTEYCGGDVTDECIQRGLHSKNPKTRQRANFARNVRKNKGKSKKSFNLQDHKEASKETVAFNVDIEPTVFRFLQMKRSIDLNNPPTELMDLVTPRQLQKAAYELIDSNKADWAAGGQSVIVPKSQTFINAPGHAGSFNMSQYKTAKKKS